MGRMKRGLCCGICTELLYQPFNLACGHVFCYSVFSFWRRGTNDSVLWTGLKKRNDVQHVENELWKNRLFHTSYTPLCSRTF